MADLQPAEKYVDIDGSRISYLVYEGDGPDIILLHATGFLSWLWHPVAKRLSGKGRIIAYLCSRR